VFQVGPDFKPEKPATSFFLYTQEWAKLLPSLMDRRCSSKYPEKAILEENHI
jgi:hypothetical protein